MISAPSNPLQDDGHPTSKKSSPKDTEQPASRLSQESKSRDAPETRSHCRAADLFIALVCFSPRLEGVQS